MTGEAQTLAQRPTQRLPRRSTPRNDKNEREGRVASFLARRGPGEGPIMQNKANFRMARMTVNCCSGKRL
jgi:hypothetical protein